MPGRPSRGAARGSLRHVAARRRCGRNRAGCQGRTRAPRRRPSRRSTRSGALTAKRNPSAPVPPTCGTAPPTASRYFVAFSSTAASRAASRSEENRHAEHRPGRSRGATTGSPAHVPTKTRSLPVAPCVGDACEGGPVVGDVRARGRLDECPAIPRPGTARVAFDVEVDLRQHELVGVGECDA